MTNLDNQEKETLNPERWVDDYGDFLFSYAISRVYSVELAEDLVQDTCLSAYTARDRFKGHSSVRTWLVSILKRKVIDYYRKKGRNKEDLVSEGNWPFEREGDNEGEWAPGHKPLNWPDETISEDAREEFMKVLYLCLSLLPDKWAATFTMRHMEDQSTGEVCKEMGITASNLWVMLHRARLQLRECIEEKWLNI